MRSRKIHSDEEVKKAMRDTKTSMISQAEGISWFELRDDAEGGEVKILYNQEFIERSKVDIDVFEKLADQVRQCHQRGQEGVFLPLHLQQWLAMVRSCQIIKPKRPRGRPADKNKVEHTLIRLAVAGLVEQGFSKSRKDELISHCNRSSAFDLVAQVNADLGKTPGSFKRTKTICAH